MKYTINLNNYSAMSYTFTAPAGSIIVEMPLAKIEAIDSRVETMSEYPEVMNILKNIK